MSSPNAAELLSTAQSRRYAAAESMLQHSRLLRDDDQGLNGFPTPKTPIPLNTEVQRQLNQLSAVPISSRLDFNHPFQSKATGRMFDYDGQSDGQVDSPQEIKELFAPIERDSVSRPSGRRESKSLAQDNQVKIAGTWQTSNENRNDSLDDSELLSPTSSRGFAARGSIGNTALAQISGNDDSFEESRDKDVLDKTPSWSEMKTKAGKERKRLPLACIACRRKKIRCSGEKPACKHCLRSRIPCVYRVTARKAAPRTDYMAMLDKRLKRMEERVIRSIPREEMGKAAAIARANVRPPVAGQYFKVQAGKKRAAEEAFEPEVDEWAQSKKSSQTPRILKSDEDTLFTEGADKLPGREIQEHLSEIFFDYLSGQPYHLLHKPSFMRRLRAGTLAPVLVLAVCAIAARFTTHPQINSEPAFLRGENWAAPARDIALGRYDEPNLTIITVFIILGLHEFGTCHGGRSWMFGGMAMRMAYALQLHHESDRDTLGPNEDKASELSFTDREIRRRTMWACFVMDRFNSSGTERPTCMNEDSLEIQLPIKELHFQMEIPGSTETLHGNALDLATSDADQISNPKDNVGVAAYLIRIIALWGRVVKYLNLGDKEKDLFPIWDPRSHFSQLKKQSDHFEASLPYFLQDNQDNLSNHAAEKVANQFLFMHIASNQVKLFLHRFAIPIIPGGKTPQGMPKSFIAEAGTAAIEAANQISSLLDNACNHQVVAPFAGYCAFMSSTVHIWGIFSKNPTLEASSKRNLAHNVKYLSKMKKYWGMFHLMAENLKDIYLQHAGASLKKASSTGAGPGESITQLDASIFQYGDWFKTYPHGVSQTDYEDPAVRIKQEISTDAALSQKSDLQSVEEFFNQVTPPSRYAYNNRKPSYKKAAKPPPLHQGGIPTASSRSLRPSNKPLQPHHLTAIHPLQSPNSLPISPTPFPPRLYHPPQHLPYTQPYTHLPSPLPSHHQIPINHDPYSTTSSGPITPNQAITSPGTLWDASIPDFINTQAMDTTGAGQSFIGIGDLATSAWYRPFNLDPPDMTRDGGGDVEFRKGGGHGGFGVQGGGGDGVV